MNRLYITVGGYPLQYTARTAGRYGCDRANCGHTPAAGTRIWVNTYGDIYCDSCASKRGRVNP